MNFARNRALEMLTTSGLWLEGLDLSQANLDELDAAHEQWREMNLHRTSLHGANLRGAITDGVELTGTRLERAALDGTSLSPQPCRTPRFPPAAPGP